MRLHLDTRTYTNFILTVIAVMLIALTLQQYGISVSSKAIAQDAVAPDATPALGNRFGRPGSSAPADFSNISQVQDPAVASATQEVAAANREIAGAIRDLAHSVGDMRDVMRTSAAAQSAVGAAAPAAPGAAPSNAPVIEVGPKR